MATPKRYEETVAEQLRQGRVGGGQGSPVSRSAADERADLPFQREALASRLDPSSQNGASSNTGNSSSRTRSKRAASGKSEAATSAGAPSTAQGDSGAAGFDPNVSDLQTSWSSYADVIYCVNTYPNGITLSVHTPKVAGHTSPASGATHVSSKQEVVNASLADASAEQPGVAAHGSETVSSKFLPHQFHLRFRDTRDYQLPVGKYYLHRENYAGALEAHFSQLHKEGKLGSAVVYFGTSTDPFLSLHKKFDVTMACIELLERYVPGMVVFQTRSPMIISVLPALKALGERAVVAMPIESISEKAIARYTPGKPRIGERLVAAEGLRRQGVRVNLMASPMLPYGDPKRDAWDFAEMLERHADYVTFGCLASGSEADEKQLKNIPIALKLAADQQFFWLRPHCYQHVYQAMKAIAPQKLILPVKKPIPPSQLNLFAA
ncbi:MAG: hypothetical protein U0136_01900 [Bdellovibrionota bacterium]